MDEKRTSPRHRVLKAGAIAFNAGRSTISCTLRNLSDHGALLKVTSPLGVPPMFELRFDARQVQCRIVRRTHQEIGVAFAASAE